MSIKAKYSCPNCKVDIREDVDEAFETFGKELVECNKCRETFVVKHSMSISTIVFKVKEVTQE